MAPAQEVVLDDFTPLVFRQGSGRSLTATNPVQAFPGPHGAANDFKASPGCSIQCITEGMAYARGAGARLVVKTDSPAVISIIVSRDGYYESMNSTAVQTEFAAHFDELEADTYYDVPAVATDDAGFTSYAFGHITTLTRNIRISYTSADLLDTPFGNDDIGMKTYAYGELIQSSNGLSPSGDNLPLGIHLIDLENVGRYLDVAIQLKQTDESPDGLCEVDGDEPDPDAGSTSCIIWASAFFAGGTALDLDNRPGDATSWTTWGFDRTLELPGSDDLPSSYGSPLNFRVNVGISVTYN